MASPRNKKEGTKENQATPALKHFKFTFQSILDSNENSIQLALVNFFSVSDGKAVFVPIDDIVQVTNPRGNNPYSERPENLANDSVHRKWLDFNIKRFGTSELILEFRNPIVVAGYTLTTANDFPGRDPDAWRLEGKAGSGSWELLDVREGVSCPAARFQAYDLFLFNRGDLGKPFILTPPRELGPTGYVEPPKFVRQSSEVVNLSWSAVQKRLPEYQALLETVVVKLPLMEQSLMQRLLGYLKGFMATRKKVAFEQALCQAISKAYGVDSQRARTKQCALANFPLYSSISAMYQYMGWRQQYMQAALEVLAEKDEPSGLLGILSLLARGGQECQARKQMAFNTLLQRVGTAVQGDEEANKIISSLSLDPQQEDLNLIDDQGVLESENGGSKKNDAAMGRVRNFLLQYLEDVKYKAFKMALLEPSLLFFNVAHDTTMEGDVEVHGTNVYAALLLATLGVRLPVAPLLHDEPKGCCSFLEATSLEPHFKAMLLPENFGRDFQHLHGVGRPSFNSRDRSRVEWNAVVFSGETAGAIANAALDPSPHRARQRAEVARYLSRFVHFFTRDVFLERAFNGMIGSEGVIEDLQQLYRSWKNTEGDIRQWIYDEEEYKFDVEKGLALFRFLGFCN